MSIKVIIFDLDDVLIHEGFNPYIVCNDTLKVLNYLKDKKYKLAIASHNNDTKEILEKTFLLDYFDYIQGFDSLDKYEHLSNIKEYFGVNFDECCLFDDLESNILLAKKLNITGFLVNYIKGITMNDIDFL